MTETSIIKVLAMFIDERKYPFQIPNAYIYMWESDYWILGANGDSKEFEIKISRQDYLKDCKKDKHKECNGANFFYYVCPEGLIKKNEVDPKYGLIYVGKTGSIAIMKKPRRLNNNQFSNWKMLAIKMYWRWRSVWRQKWIDKEITYEEYLQAFAIQITNELKNVGS